MFKVGDIITGLDDITYYITNNKATLEVIRIRLRGDMVVKLLDHVDLDEKRRTIGQVFDVDPKYFKLLENAPTAKTAIERKIAFMYQRFERRGL